jgi:nucleoside-diphosphate-sugar epimerase
MNVLITGAGGFIGRHCVPLLAAADYEVHAVSLHPIADLQATTPEAYWHQTDLFDSNAVAELISRVQPTHLLHLAWYAVPGEYWTSSENYRWVDASLNLVQEFVKNGGQRVVVAGTCAEYDWSAGYCSEQSTPIAPRSPYAACKHDLHLKLEAMAKHHEFSLAWGRLFFLYGPYERRERLVPSVINSLLANEPAACSHGEQIRDYVYVKDAAAAFAALVGSPVTGAVNVASGHCVALKEVIWKIGNKLGRPELLQIGARKVDEAPRIVADTTRLAKEVGWSPQYDLDRGLDETINWWRLIDSRNSVTQRTA